MKCPKCNYNSFEYLDSCKKCNSDLSNFKSAHNIQAIILPLRPIETSIPHAGESASEFTLDTGVSAETEGSMFSWHDSSEQNIASGGVLSARDIELHGTDLENDPFSFDLDLPSAEPEAVITETQNEFTLDDLTSETLGESAPAPEAPLPSTEAAPFGDFSFDELYKQDAEPSAFAEQEPNGDMADGVDDVPQPVDVETEPGEFSFDDLEAGSSTPLSDTAFIPATGEPDAVDFNEFSFDENSSEAEPEDESVDTMGLSAEEYESLFGELPTKKRKNPAD